MGQVADFRNHGIAMKLQLFLTGLVGLVAAAGVQAQTWDLASDFSTTINPNGAWNYGKYDTGGMFTANTTAGSFFGFGQGWVGDGGNGRPFVGINNSGGPVAGSQNGQVFVHPDFGSADHPYAGIQWIAPYSGTFDVTVTFFAGDTNSVSEFVSRDRTTFIDLRFDIDTDWTLTFTQAMSAGQFFDFFVGPNGTGNPSNGTTPLDIRIADAAAVPEPASLIALALGISVLAHRRKRS